MINQQNEFFLTPFHSKTPIPTLAHNAPHHPDHDIHSWQHAEMANRADPTERLGIGIGFIEPISGSDWLGLTDPDPILRVSEIGTNRS